MRKVDLLLSGFFLFSVSVFAQQGPVRYADDPKQIFVQDFESNVKWQEILLNEDMNRPTTLYTWESEPIDKIEQVTYYKYQAGDYRTDVVEDLSSGSLTSDIYNGSFQWEISGVRDTLIELYNGVIRTDGAWPEDSIFGYDSHDILSHTPETQSGTGVGGKDYGLDRYGENGGKKYFSYSSADASSLSSNSSAYNVDKKAVAEWRRNLFIRLNDGDIEPMSSYRVTVFVKSTPLSDDAIPRVGLELLRGSFHSEKPFLVDDKGSYTTNSWGQLSIQRAAFDDKTDCQLDEPGKWQKLTLMAFYNNDSIGDASPYLLGYYWLNDWAWQTKANSSDYTASDNGDTTMIFRAIQQPDKFFVRMSFRGDLTEYDVDNLSLTKSWIGGVEHFRDMIRVDFGYETNLNQKAQEAMKINKIATVEVPGEYFEVWARYGDDWQLVPIRSAEYQGDGFMYMWTQPTQGGEPVYLETAEEVLVTFRNPTDRPDLMLNYSGSRYPNGLDTKWVMEGKKVFDFHNEISALNPTIVVSPKTGKVVKSLKDLPPVLQYEAYEDGTFGLDPTMRSMKVKFSRPVAFDNVGASTNLTKVTLKNGNGEEYWEIESSDENGYTMIVRPSKYTSPLAGDYVLSFTQVTHSNNPVAGDGGDYGDDEMFNYHFGDFTANPDVVVFAMSDWRGHIVDFTFGGSITSRPLPYNIYLHDAKDAFQSGEGVPNNTKVGLHPLKDDTLIVAGTKVPDNCFFYLSSRANNTTGNLYAIEHLKAGKYAINFKFGGRSSVNYPMSFYFYAKPEGNLDNGNDNGFAKLEAAVKTQLIKNIMPASGSDMGEGGFDKAWASSAELITCNFVVPEEGDYVFEWVNTGSNSYYGVAIGNYWITSTGDLSFESVKMLNEAIGRIADKLSEVNVTQYYGEAFNALKAIQRKANSYIATTTAANEGHNPSAYSAFVTDIDAAIDAMDLRVDAVNQFNRSLNKVAIALEDRRFDFTKAYNNLLGLNKDLDALSIPDMTNQELAEFSAQMIKAIGDLEGIEAVTRRIIGLANLALELGSDITENETVKSRLNYLCSDDDYLAEVLKAAIKLAIYQKATDPVVDNLDMTPFIKNYLLYTTPIVEDRSKYSMPSNKSYLDVDGANGAQIQKVNHQYNNVPIWIMILRRFYTTLYPGWTVTAFDASGNCMITPDDDNYSHFKADIAVWDGKLAMDWNSKAELSQEVAGLPAGAYTLGVEFEKQSGSGTILSAEVNGMFYESMAASSGINKITIDSIDVYDGNMTINLLLTSGSGWSAADNFSLIFNKLDDYNYAAEITQAQSELDNALLALENSPAPGPGPDDPIIPDTIITVEPSLSFADINTFTMYKGGYTQIPVTLENSELVTAFQFDVTLPAGMSVTDVSLDKYHPTHNISFEQTGGLTKVTCYSSTNEMFNKDEGVVAYLTVYVDNSISSYWNTIQISNIELTRSAYKSYHPKGFSAFISVLESYTPGDVNKDGSITITDVVGIINFLINADTSGLSRPAADADGDGNITISDAVTVVNMILGRNKHAASRTSVRGELTSALAIDDMSVSGGMTFDMPVNLVGMDGEITAMQFDLSVPENVKLNGITTVAGHIVSYNRQDDGTYKVVCLSLDNSTFNGNGESVIKLNLATENEFISGMVTLNDVLMVSPDNNSKVMDAVYGLLTGDGTTGMKLIGNDRNSEIYDLGGRKVIFPEGIHINNGQKLWNVK